MEREMRTRRIRKLEKKVKESRQMVAWLSNEIHRRKTKRKLTKEEKKNFTKATEQGAKQINKERRSSQDKRNMARGIRVPKNKVRKNKDKR